MKLRSITAPRQSIPVRLATFLAVAGLFASASVLAPTWLLPRASASCSPIEVVFARGRLESPGAGVIGNSFVSSLRSKVNRPVSLYAVRYPADTEVDVGANDMSAHVQNTINGCPDTRIVLGGYSLGAAVTDVVVAAPIAAFGFTNPLPPGADQHIAAVALFGNGSQWVGPITNFNPVYNDRTIDMCHGADPVCNPADPHTWSDNWPQHSASQYIQAGMVNQAADFVASKLQ
jgi:cutinase